MKKMILGLCALVACFVFASCGGNPTETVKNLAEKAKDIKTYDEAKSLTKDFIQASIDFFKSNPTKEEAEEFQKACQEFSKATEAAKLPEEEQAKALKDTEFLKEIEELNKELKKVTEEWEKAQKDEKEDKE